VRSFLEYTTQCFWAYFAAKTPDPSPAPVLAFAQQNRNPARPSGPRPTTYLLNLLKQEKTGQAMRDIKTRSEADRYFTFPKLEETAKNVAAMLKRAGLEDVEIGNPPADGLSQGGWWTMPLAWDVKTGTLEILD
jgi:hypothetical protein